MGALVVVGGLKCWRFGGVLVKMILTVVEG